MTDTLCPGRARLLHDVLQVLYFSEVATSPVLPPRPGEVHGLRWEEEEKEKRAEVDKLHLHKSTYSG